MQARKKRNTKKRLKLFDADDIATKIHQSVCRDLSSSTQKYGALHPLGFYAKDQKKNLLKKFVGVSTDNDKLTEEAYEKFKAINDHMGKVESGFKRPTAPRITSTVPDLEKILMKARALMHTVVATFDEDELFHLSQHGPGTSIGTSFMDSSVEAKFTFPISMTARVAPLFDRYLLHDFTTRRAVEDFNTANPVSDRYLLVKGSRATTVDKTNSARRMIAIEPTGNMFFQQGLMQMLYKRMEHVGLNLETLQHEHRERARIASITSQEATIDWSSASDCTSRELLRWLMPPKWFAYLELVRCPTMELNGEDVELNMFSTMGNATTFPLETLVFWTIGHALQDLRDGNNSLFHSANYDFSTISVFGDDCIVPTKLATDFMSVLEQVGFIVNTEKSFYSEDEGFRESCGGDFFHGYDVRPFHLKAPASTKQSNLEPWLYIIANRLLQKYIMYFGRLNYIYEKELWKTLAKLFSEHHIKIKLVPVSAPDDSGLKIAFDLERWATHYPSLTFEKISVSRHGTISYLYHRFIYRDREERFEHLHMTLALKGLSNRREITFYQNLFPVPTRSIPNEEWKSTKHKGGYIVAKGITCHWHVPRIAR